MELLHEGFIEGVTLLWQRDALVWDAAWRSLWISVLAVLCAGVCGVTLGSVLARKRSLGSSAVVLLLRAGMGLPTVLIGLLCYAVFSRRGILSGLELLYTPWAIVIGEFCLALPIIATWTHRAIRSLDPKVAETAWTLGAGVFRRWWTYLREVQASVMLALLTAFARCSTELGIAMMVGGNIKFRTRTLTTATALETAQGEFARGMAMSLILLLISLLVAVGIGWLSRDESVL